MDKDNYRLDIRIEVNDPGMAQLERIDREIKNAISKAEDEWGQRLVNALENTPKVKK